MVTAENFFHCFDCPTPDALFSDPGECGYFYQCSGGRPYLKVSQSFKNKLLSKTATILVCSFAFHGVEKGPLQ
jgi:hypothetical protein